MQIEFRRPCADDFRRIELQPFDAPLQEQIRAAAVELEALALADPGSLTCLEDGRVVGIGGILSNGEAWQFFAADCRRAFRPMMTRIRAAIVTHALTQGDVWAIIDANRPNARRWAALLGFDHLEGDIWLLSSSTL